MINKSLPSGWKETTLSEIAEIIMGQSPRGESYNTNKDGLPFYQGVTEYGDKYVDVKTYTNQPSKIIEKYTILFSVRAPVGRVNITRQKSCIGRGNAGLRMKNNQQEFLYYLLKYLEKAFLKNTTGTVFDSISGVELRKFKIVIAENETEQQAIAKVLSSLDDKIELLREQNKTLESLSRTIFDSKFTNERHLENEPIDRLIQFNPTEKINREKEYNFFEMKCLSNDSMSISDGITRNLGSASNFRNHDTLMAKITPCLENGKTGFVTFLNDDEVARGSTEFIVMRPKKNTSPYFVYCLARNSAFRDYAIKSMNGSSGRQRVQVDLLKLYSINTDQENMNKFHDACSPIFNKIKNNSDQINNLSATRDILLPQLLSGKIRVKI